MNVTFNPSFTGVRYGAAVLRDSSGVFLGIGYMQGIGIGPQIQFQPTTEIAVPTSALSGPQGVAVDGQGDVYVADWGNNRVLKEAVSDGGYTESVVSTSSLNGPWGLAVDGAGSLYIADSSNNRVLKEAVTETGYSETIIPTSALEYPSGISVDGGGNLFIADSGNNRVLEESWSGSSYTETTVPTNTLDFPSAVAVDSGGNVYVADTYNQRVLKEAPSSGSYSETVVSTSALFYPEALTIDGEGNLYIADTGNNRILKETISGSGYTENVVATSSLNSPSALAVDSKGNVVVIDFGNNRVIEEDGFDRPSLSFLPTAPNGTSADSPQTVTVANIGNAALTFPVPASGNNPSISANFSLSSSGGSACPLVPAGASGPGSLVAGASCQLPISFTPSAAGTFSGTLVLSDNALNTAATQTIQLSGTGTGSTQQTITFGSIGAQSANTTLVLTATASSGLPITFASTTPSVCTVSGATASLLTAGTCSITASQPGNGEYAAATPVTQSFTVSLAAQTITFASIPNQAGNTSIGVSLNATASSGLQVTFTSTTPSVCTVSGATATLLAAGTCSITASQPGDGATYAAATPVTQSFTAQQATPSADTNFGTVSVGSTSTAQTVTFVFPASGTLETILVLTGGAIGMDFANAGTGSCEAGTSYNSGDICTISVTFAPTVPGTRSGAIVLLDGAGNRLGIMYLQGAGVAAGINFMPGLQSIVTTSTLNAPMGVAVDANDDVYIADTYNNRILKETLSEGTYAESVAPTSSLSWPSGVTVDAAGDIYIADTGNNRILEEVPVANGFTESVIPSSALSGPAAVAVDAAGDVYIADTGNNRILLESYSASGYTESTIPTSSLSSPYGVAVDGSGNLYVADTYNNRILMETYSGGEYSESTLPTNGTYFPFGVTVDATGSVYVADTNNARILKEAFSGGSYSQMTVPNLPVSSPAAVAVDGKGNVFVADTGNGRILTESFTLPPTLTFANTAPNGTSADSPQTVTVANIGNAALTFPVPASGNNPSISANFTLNSSGGSACPLVTAGGSPSSLAAGASCQLPISFTPSAAGNFSGALVLSDNALNTAATQTIQLSGTGTGSTQQTITFGSIGAQSANTTLVLTATASSGLPITFASTTPSVCTVSGATASLVAAGTCSVTASQPGNSEYAAATPVTQSFTVNLAAQTITFESMPNQVENASVEVALSATASSGLPITFASTTPSVCTVSGATASLLIAGTCSITASQPGDGVTFAAATPVTQSFTVETVNPLTGTGFGAVNAGTTSSPVTVSLTITTAGTPASISVLTEGVTGLDFANTGTGSCATGTSYSAGDTCSVNVTFTPALTGTRYGAVVLEDSSGTLLAVAYTQGTGIGPQVAFSPGTESTVPNGAATPEGIAVDGNGNLYIADTTDSQVLKETRSGSSYTESTVPVDYLNSPGSIAVDGEGTIYIADTGDNQIWVETPAGTEFTGTILSTSALNGPAGVAVDGSGNVYIADTGNNRVLLESFSNGTYTESTIPTSTLAGPSAVAADGNGDVYVVDTGNNRVLEETLSNGSYSESVIQTSPLNEPTSVYADALGNVYIVDSGNNRVLKETRMGNGYSESTLPTSSLDLPYGVAVNGGGNVYISDTYNDRVLEEDYADPPSLSFQPTAPNGTSADSPQTVTVADIGNAALTFPVPASGNNPSISANFSLSSSGGSACPLVVAGGSPGSLAAGASCQLPISFTPSAAGNFSGTLVLSDNALNTAAAQTIQLSGTGTGSTQQTITFGSIGEQSANTTLALTATASSGLPVTLASTTPLVCTVSGATASLLTAGTCSITVSQPGNTEYAAATPVTQSFTVSLAAQSITFGSIPNQVGNTSIGVSLNATASSGLQVSFASTTPSVCTVSGVTATLLAAGTCSITASQPGDGATYAAATPVTQSFTVETVNPLTGTGFGSVNIGTTSSPISVSLTITTAGTPASISVLTEGVTGLDFANAGTGSCATGTSYNAGDTCSVNVTFTPAFAGTRSGGISLQDSSGALLAVAYIQGTGVGPQVAFSPGTESIIPSSVSSPQGIAIDGGGDVYVADGGNNRILKETLSANTYTESTMSTSSLSFPGAVAVDGSGTVFVLDTGNSRVLKETPSQDGYTESTVTTTSLSSPWGLAVDAADNIYIADSGNNRILMETPDGSSYSETVIPTSPLNSPEAVAVDASGNIYVADTGNDRILRESYSSGEYAETVITTSSLNSPCWVALDAVGDIFISDSGNNRILEESVEGSGYVETALQTSSLSWQDGIAVDGQRNIYIADSGNNRLLKEDDADPPAVAFETAQPGSTSSDSPKTVDLINVGNSPLTFPIPQTGTNPGISANFTLTSTESTACPLVAAGSSGAGTLGAGQNCLLQISFTPSTTGDLTGQLTLSDNALNTTTAQSIQLSGTGGTSDMDSPQKKQTADACSVPVITSITPATWFAGKTYHLTITGANFVTSSMGCGDMLLGPTALSILTNQGFVTIGQFQILSSTVIQATVTPDINAPTEPAQVTIYDKFAFFGPIKPAYVTPGGNMMYGSTLNTQILGTPQIKWDGQTIANSQCALTNGQILSDGSTRCVVVGQQISLTTNVATGDGQGNITLPGGLAVNKNAWTAGGTTIGQLNLVLPNGSTSSESIVETKLTVPTITAYWLYPQSNVSTTYQYCAMIPGLSVQDSNAGANCSSPANATFNVQGPAATIDPRTELPYAYGYLVVTPPLSACEHKGAQSLVFGLPALGAASCDPDLDLNGIDFLATNVANVPNSGGGFLWIQLVDSDQIYFEAPVSGAGSYIQPGSTGLDNRYPAFTGLEAHDAPEVSLVGNLGYRIVGRKFSARMYLMWRSSIANTIAVPIGYVQWSFSGDAKQSANHQWKLNTPGTTNPLYHASGAGDPYHGMPIWSSLALNTQPY